MTQSMLANCICCIIIVSVEAGMIKTNYSVSRSWNWRK